MPINNPKYDVALSFLSSDQSIAAALHRQLSESLKVFFFARSQEELAGTDGLESMREPFLSESRVMVVLYRDRWGQTPWTRVEETAIKDACFAHGWRRLLFLVMDTSSSLPTWLPETHVRFNYSEYGSEQAVGAIKARVQENGGTCEPLTAAKRAEIFRIDEVYRRDKALMNTAQGLSRILDEVAKLFSLIDTRCADISGDGHLKLRCGVDFRPGNAFQQCIATNDVVSLAIIWQQQYSNILDNSFLAVRQFNAALPLPAESAGRVFLFPPQRVSETKYVPELSLARDFGWKKEGGEQFLPSTDLAEQCLITLLNLIDRRASGKLKPPPM
jgi:hypothetical protein